MLIDKPIFLFDLSVIERCILKYSLVIVDFPSNYVKFCFIYFEAMFLRSMYIYNCFIFLVNCTLSLDTDIFNAF